MSHYQLVCHFNKLWQVSHVSARELFQQKPQLAELRAQLIYKKLNQLVKAWQYNNMVDIIKGLANSLYVCYGLFYCFERDADELFLEYMYNHYNIKFNHDDHFCMVGFVCRNSQKYNITWLQESKSNLQEAFTQKKVLLIIDRVLELIFGLYVIAYQYQIDINQAFKLVHLSNMSKVCHSVDEAQASVCAYQEQGLSMVSSVPQNEYWIVFNEETGKVMKSINYQPVQLRPGRLHFEYAD